MGVCFSKKKKIVADKEDRGRRAAAAVLVDKKPVFIMTHNAMKTTLPKAKPELSVHDSIVVSKAQEVDAILIQCGKLSRNPSSEEDKKYSGAKRIYGFENDKSRGEEEASRPSPRPTTPNRVRSGRLGVHESKQQPAKMVSVPAREKEMSKRSPSPRSRSPANNSRLLNENALVHHSTQPQPHSSSCSEKAEQPPYTRNPMTEISDNSNKEWKSKEGKKGVKKDSQNQSLRTKEEEKPESEIVEHKEPKGSSKGTVEDIQNYRKGLQKAAYASLLLEDRQNYHKQNAAFPLPACVFKPRSILEAVADLKSSSSDKSYNHIGWFVESEIVVKDDLTEPTLHKYISMNDLVEEMEPQESVGSNSFMGHPWRSLCELNAVDSTYRYRASEIEVEDLSQEKTVRDFDASGGSSTISSRKNRGLHHCELYVAGSRRSKRS